MTQIYVGGVGLSQTFINFCIYGIFNHYFRLKIHFFVPNPKSQVPNLQRSMGWVGGSTSLGHLSQIKPVIFVGASLNIIHQCHRWHWKSHHDGITITHLKSKLNQLYHHDSRCLVQSAHGKSKRQMQGRNFDIKSEGNGKSCSKKTTFKSDFIGK